jgi:regulatory protein
MRAKRTRTSDPWLDLTRLLRERPRSVFEVRQRLKQRGHDEDAIGKTIRAALDAGLLDDRAFAKLWVTDRLWHHPLSRAALAKELHDKGIEPAIIDTALGEFYPAVREVELARDLAETRFGRLRGIDRERRRNRTVNHLMRRGFSRHLACDVVRQIEKEAEDE